MVARRLCACMQTVRMDFNSGMLAVHEIKVQSLKKIFQLNLHICYFIIYSAINKLNFGFHLKDFYVWYITRQRF